MWMFEIELADGVIVHAPQAHRHAPLLHLAVDGRVFVYMPGGLYQHVARSTSCSRGGTSTVRPEWVFCDEGIRGDG
jgi:hypothetical protein